LVLSAVVILGFTACSDGLTEAADPTPVVTVTVTVTAEPVVETPVDVATPASVEPEPPAESQLIDPSLQACLDISNKLTVAYTEMAQIMGTAGGSDMQATVDMYTELADALGEIAETTSLPGLKDAAHAAQDDFTAIRDGLKSFYVDGDMSGLSKLTDAMLSMQTSYLAVLEHCGI